MSQEELNSKLLEAAENGDTDTMWELVEQGADVNAQDRWERTALMLSAWYGHLTPELLEALVSRGADVNAQDNDGETALMCLAYSGRLTPELLKTFISHGANINARNKWGKTALMRSAEEDYLMPPNLAHAYVEQFIRLGTSLEEIYKQATNSDSKAVLVYVLLKKLETEPGLVVDFMKKYVGKKLQEWVDNNVEGANILVSRLVPYIVEKRSAHQNVGFL